ncbi:MAG: hypothetical protein ACI8ZN_000413 [Bacteroidia bacterium]|jgi:hypothetical protein
MKQLLTNLLIVASIFILGGCGAQKNVPKNASITFQRTACYGTCPIYKMLVTSDGVVKFTGDRFTDMVGEWHKQLSKKETKELFNSMASVNWEDYLKDYPSYVSDLPSTVLGFNYKKIEKEIVITGEHPKKLDEFTKQLQAIVDAEGWQNMNVK